MYLKKCFFSNISIYKMKYKITTQITSFNQIDWISVQNLIGGEVTELECYDNQITSFQHLPNSVTTLICYHNQITSFRHLPNSVTELYCSYNQITSFKHLVNSVNVLNCNSNQITSFQHLPK